jgi:hypothetical protein
MIAQGGVGNYVNLDKIRLTGRPRTFVLIHIWEMVDSAAYSVKSHNLVFMRPLGCAPKENYNGEANHD